MDVTNGLETSPRRGLDNGGTGTAARTPPGIPSAGFFYDDGRDGDFKRRDAELLRERPLGSALSNDRRPHDQLTFLNDLEVSMILRAVEKSTDFQLINNQVLSVHNTQRAYVAVINQQAYIQDFDVEVAQFQAVADPQINVLHEGVVLDVRPTIHHNRKYLTLEIQPTVAKVVALRNVQLDAGRQHVAGRVPAPRAGSAERVHHERDHPRRWLDPARRSVERPQHRAPRRSAVARQAPDRRLPASSNEGYNDENEEPDDPDPREHHGRARRDREARSAPALIRASRYPTAGVALPHGSAAPAVLPARFSTRAPGGH
jgi:hypothetical protein